MNSFCRFVFTAIVMAPFFVSTALAQDPKFTGLLPTPEEEYKAIPQLSRSTDPVILSQVDLTSRFPTPGNQGRLGSCTGWAIGYAARSYYNAAMTGKKPVSSRDIASPGFLYNFTAVYPPEVDAGCGGAYFKAALDFAKIQGTPPLSEWPYNDTSCRPNQATPYQYELASQLRIPDYRRYQSQALKDAWAYKADLQAGHPIVIGMALDENVWMTFSGSNVMNGPKLDVKGLSLHAMAIVGYDDSRNAFRLQNSWGTRWGDNGFAWVDYDYFTHYISEAYVFLGLQPALQPLSDWNVEPESQDDELVSELVNITSRYPSVVTRIVEFEDGFSVDGHGCSAAVERLRGEIYNLSPLISTDFEETPWPACETRGYLSDAIERDNVSLSVENLRAAETSILRGVEIDSWIEEDVANTPVFYENDLLKISVALTESRPYLQLFYLQADRSAKEVFRGLVPKDETGKRSITFGTPESNLKLKVSPPFGTEAVIAVTGTKPIITEKLAENAADSNFLSALRDALGNYTLGGGDFGAAVVQMQIEEAPAKAANWLITPREFEELENKDRFLLSGPFSASTVKVKGNLEGPEITILSPDLMADLKGEVAIKTIFQAKDSASIDPASFRVKYKTGLGWFDVTKRVRKNAIVTSTGVEAEPMKLPKGKHKIRMSIHDDKGREGLVEIRVEITDS